MPPSLPKSPGRVPIANKAIAKKTREAAHALSAAGEESLEEQAEAESMDVDAPVEELLLFFFGPLPTACASGGAESSALHGQPHASAGFISRTMRLASDHVLLNGEPRRGVSERAASARAPGHTRRCTPSCFQEPPLHTPLRTLHNRTVALSRVQRWQNQKQSSFAFCVYKSSPGKRCGATAQSALGWYRPSVGVPETLDGKPSGVLV